MTSPLARVSHRRVLVVGGGIAGLTAALEAAAAGLPVTLAEAGPALGGLMALLDKTFPTNDCAMCILSPRMLAAARHPLIEVRTFCRVLGVKGGPGDFKALLGRQPRYVDLDKCTGCGDCTRVCPKKIPDPYNLGLAATRAIHVPFPQAIPQAAYINAAACRTLRGKKCGACAEACAAGAVNFAETPSQQVLEAGAIILAPGAEPRPVHDFPGYGQGDVVTALEFERLLSATGPNQGRLARPSDGAEPERLAFLQCVGSRDLVHGVAYCSNLCCMASLKEALAARELTQGRAQATLFYMDLRTHGKGYEAYLEQARRLGLKLVRSRAAGVRPLPGGGVAVRYADPQGRAREEAFDLAVLAVGLKPTAALPEWGAALGLGLNPYGFLDADPLTAVQTSRPGIFVCGSGREPMDISDAVTAAGAAAAAASQLLAVSRRTLAAPPPLPAAAPEVEPTPRIGVFLCHCGANIAKTIDLARLARKVSSLPGVALVADEMFACAVEAARRLQEAIRGHQLNRVVVAACTPRTHEPVFREVLAAAGLNPGYLSFANVREQCAWVHQDDPDAALAKAGEIIRMAVQRAWRLNPIQRRGFAVDPKALVLGGGAAGLTAALTLARHGFHTYLVERQPHLGGLARRLFFTLAGFDPQEFLHDLQSQAFRHPNIEVLAHAELVKVSGHVGRFSSLVRQRTPAGVKERTLTHGVILAATGGEEFSPLGRFLYGADHRVITQQELEAKIHGQHLDLPQVRQVVMIQCVGSREPERPYCSRVCCAQALKNALLLKARYPLADIAILYRDIRAYGFKERYYQEAKERGVRFLPFEPERPPRVEARRRRPLTVWVWDELLGAEAPLAADLVVLSAGLKPAPDARQVAQRLKIPLSADGFFLEAHQKLRPVDAAADGVFLCGLAHSPQSLAEAVTQARAAAMRAAALLYQPELWHGEVIAAIRPGQCRQCLTCLRCCPFGAVHLGPGRSPEIIPELCQGCGVCLAECPYGAIDVNRGGEAEVLAQMAAALR